MPVLLPENQDFRKLMEAAGWNQARAADALDVSPATISDYINGKTKPPSSKIELMRRLVNEHLKGSPLLSEQEADYGAVTGFEHFSPATLETFFKTFATTLLEAQQRERKPLLRKLNEIVAEMEKHEERKAPK